MSTLVLKTCYEGDIRRISVDTKLSFEKLVKQIKGLYGISSFTLRYTDDEGDEITLTSTEELEEAIRLTHLQKPPILRIQLHDVQKILKPEKTRIVVSPQEEKQEIPRISKNKCLSEEREAVQLLLPTLIKCETKKVEDYSRRDKGKPTTNVSSIMMNPIVCNIPLSSPSTTVTTATTTTTTKNSPLKTFKIKDSISSISAETVLSTQKEADIILKLINEINCDFSPLSELTSKQAENYSKLTSKMCSKLSSLVKGDPSYLEGKESETTLKACSELAAAIAKSTEELSRQSRTSTGSISDEIAFTSMCADTDEKSTDLLLKDINEKCNALFEETKKITESESGNINTYLLDM